MGRSHAANSHVVDELVVKHYGVKGMHWGVRKSDPGSGSSAPAAKPAPRPRRSEDAKNVEKAFAKIDRGGTDALSNQELRSLTERLNLEQNYERLVSSPTPKQQNQLDRGHNLVKTALSYGKTYNQVKKFMNSDGGKLLKTGFKAAMFGVKAYTNPVGTAVSLVTPKNHFTNVG